MDDILMTALIRILLNNLKPYYKGVYRGWSKRSGFCYIGGLRVGFGKTEPDALEDAIARVQSRDELPARAYAPAYAPTEEARK